MNDDSIVSVSQLKEFARLTDNITFKSKNKKETYQWVNDVLNKFSYLTESKKNRSIIKKYIIHMTGYSHDNVDKLIAKKRKYGDVCLLKRTQHTFARRYTPEDITLLAEVNDSLLGQNAKAMKRMMKDQYEKFHDERFKRLANISVSHIYNLKKTHIYKSKVLTYTKTNPTKVNIGIRKKPQPDGKPGYIRVDSVHQGDFNKNKGVYHINLVDEVTQFEIMVSVERISERYLIPALAMAFDQFPFKIINFHSDNGSEYLNRDVTHLLQKMFVTHTKSRARKSQDNGLVEGKNAAIIRKYLGHTYIPQKCAEKINTFYRDYLNDYVNYHRYSAFAREKIDSKGKIKKDYSLEDYHIPVLKLLSIENVEHYLKSGITQEKLKAKMLEESHFDVAQKVKKAREKLFGEINSR